MDRCNLEGCSLINYIDELKDDQQKLTGKHDTILEKHGEIQIAQAEMVVKVDGWMEGIKTAGELNEREHDALFERTRDVTNKDDIKGMATYGGILKILGGISTFLLIFVTILSLAGLI